VRAKEHYTQQNEEGELETEEDDRKKRSEWRGRPVKWLHWSLSETPMVRDHFPPLFSLASSYPNPRISPTPYSSLRVSSILSKRDSKEKKRKERLYPRNKLPAVHTGVATTPSRTHRPPSPFVLYREYERAGRDDMEVSRDHFQQGELPNCLTTQLSIFMNSDERLHGITISLCLLLPLLSRRLLWIVSRESNDRDEADEMEQPLHWTTNNIYVSFFQKVS